MVNTFMPYTDFKEVAKCLDYRRLGKQRVETWQIYRALTGQSTGWVNHPATKMWKGFESSLLYYGICMCEEWIVRGYNDTMLPRFLDEFKKLTNINKEIIIDIENPHWIYDEQSLLAYKSNLVRKDKEFYGKLWPNVPDDLPYTWGEINGHSN